jgi:hypothetical protein
MIAQGDVLESEFVPNLGQANSVGKRKGTVLTDAKGFRT